MSIYELAAAPQARAHPHARPQALTTFMRPARSFASLQPDASVCSVSLLKKFSRISPCTLNTTFGCNGNASNAAVWVARGCRGKFACNEEVVACGFPGQLHGSIEWCRCTRRRIVPTKLEACAIRAPSCNAFRGTEWVQRWTSCNTPGNTASRSSPRTVVVAVRFSESLQTICWVASLPVHRVYLINKGSPLPPNASSVLGRLVREVRMANIARESYSYLDAMRALRARLCDPRVSRIIFMQAHHGKTHKVASWAGGVVALSSGAAPCFSYYGDVRPFSFGLRTSAGLMLADALRDRYRSRHICPHESWDEFTLRTSFGCGATFATSSEAVCSLSDATLRDMQEEINASWVPAARDMQYLFPLGVHKMEFIYERSWERLMSGCTVSATLPPCACSCGRLPKGE